MATPVPTGIVNAIPLAQMFQAGTQIPGIKLYFATCTTSATGVGTIYPTSDGTATGTALFSNILHASATGWSNTSTLTLIPTVSGKSISSDLKTVTFNTLVPTGILLGGTSASFGPSGIQLTCVVWGLP